VTSRSTGVAPELRAERGSASLEVVLIFPAVILLIALIIQFALWEQATHAAIAAAQDGVQVARLEGSTASAGKSRAEDFLQQTARTLISSPVVTASRNNETAMVTITGTVTSLVPGLHLQVEGSASGVVERFRPTGSPGP